MILPYVLVGQYVVLCTLRTLRAPRRARALLSFGVLAAAAAWLSIGAAARATPHARFVQVMGAEPPRPVGDIFSRRYQMSLDESGRVLSYRIAPGVLPALLARCGFVRAEAPGWYAGGGESWEYRWLHVSDSGDTVTAYSGSMFKSAAACEEFERRRRWTPVD